MADMSAIRNATVADASLLAELAERTFRHTFAADNTAADINEFCSLSFGPAQQRAELLDPGMRTFLSGPLAAPDGFAQIRLKSKAASVDARWPIELYRIYVVPEAKGKGVAQALIQAVFDAARAAQADRLWLGVWERNARALAFYRRLGFVECGEHEFVLGRDRQRDLILQRVVQQ